MQVARSDIARVEATGATEAELGDLVAGNNRFAFNLYRELAGSNDQNLFLSPYSISISLAMTWAGAAGDTETQMTDALGFNLEQSFFHAAFNALDQQLASRSSESGANDEPQPELNIANAIWGQRGYEFRPTFLDTLSAHYGAGLRQLDFSNQAGRQHAADLINDWAKEKTRDKIPSLVSPDRFGECSLPELVCTQMVLTNAIYFKGDWADEFDANLTRDGDFHLADGARVKVPMMAQNKNFEYAESSSYQAVQLRYQGDELAMVILLSAKGDFDAFETALNEEIFVELAGGLRGRDVILTMPRFKLETSFSAVEPLRNLGMTDAFHPEMADFSGMVDYSEKAVPDSRIFISEVLQKTFVEVNERGTEAAAAASVVSTFSYLSIPEPPVEMKVDRPFMFLIRDVPTGTILFLGRVIDPRGEG